MKLFYNSIALHDLGQIVITSQAAVGKPEAAPQWWEKTLSVKILFKQSTYADNQALANQVRAIAKSEQEGQLQLQDDAGNDLVNQTAKVLSHDQPADPNAKGQYLQSIDITFWFVETFDAKQSQAVLATFQRTGVSTPVITLGNVESLKYQTDVRRYSPFRSHREMASGRIEARGRFVGDPLSDVATRRAALMAAADQMRSEIAASKDGQFKFGTIDKTIRIENFVADYDQALNFLPWSLSGTFTEFPNESGYAQAEFVVDTQQNQLEGKQFLSLSGTIAADSPESAQAKLSSIRTTFAPDASWTMLQGGGGKEERIDGGDGTAWIRLSFDERFEKTISDLVEWELHLSDDEEVATGTIRRTYSGHVIGAGSTFDAAYQTATVKAKSLGDDKHQFKLTGSITADDKQFSSQRQVTGTIPVKVEFNFSYRLKSADRLFATINSEFNREVFGLDVETVSGTIAASTVTAARSRYDSIKAGYAAFMIRNERVNESREKIANKAITGSNLTPPDAGSWGTTVNAAESADNVAEPASSYVTNPTLLGAGYTRQWTKLDFSFAIHRPKSSATGQVAIKYQFSTFKDYIAREIVTTFSGTIWAATEAIANTFLTSFESGLTAGTLISSRRNAGYEKAPPSNIATLLHRADPVSNGGSVFLAIEFEDVFNDLLPGDTIIRCELKESLKTSGGRVVVQPTASDVDVLQTCGQQSGRRVISGTVVATNETLCFTWIRKQRTLPLGGGFSQSGAAAFIPPEFEISGESIPLRELKFRNDDGTPYTGDKRAKFVSVSFSFEEVLQQISFT